ncbi:MAG: hypothetical protein V3W41_22260 [Planctomycetota bacterium]
MSHFEFELDELARDNDLVLWFSETEALVSVWGIALVTGEEYVVGTGETEAEALKAARKQIRIWEERKR